MWLKQQKKKKKKNINYEQKSKTKFKQRKYFKNKQRMDSLWWSICATTCILLEYKICYKKKK